MTPTEILALRKTPPAQWLPGQAERLVALALSETRRRRNRRNDLMRMTLREQGREINRLRLELARGGV